MARRRSRSRSSTDTADLDGAMLVGATTELVVEMESMGESETFV
jgi:hypothetical protein